MTTKITSPVRCKDCPPDSKRPALYPGPRCATHHRRILKIRKQRLAERRDAGLYGLTPQEREEILAAQGGRCAFCRQATGKARRLAVDHDHALAEQWGSIRHSIRGLLCGRCNVIVGILGDDPTRFEEIAAYLRERPAQKILQP